MRTPRPSATALIVRGFRDTHPFSGCWGTFLIHVDLVFAFPFVCSDSVFWYRDLELGVAVPCNLRAQLPMSSSSVTRLSFGLVASGSSEVLAHFDALANWLKTHAELDL